MRHCVIFDTLKVDGLGDHSTKIIYSEIRDLQTALHGHCTIGSGHPSTVFALYSPKIIPKRMGIFRFDPRPGSLRGTSLIAQAGPASKRSSRLLLRCVTPTWLDQRFQNRVSPPALAMEWDRDPALEGTSLNTCYTA